MSSKKSFVMYESWGELIKNLPDDMAGKLSKMICEYAFTGSDPSSEDPAINAMFQMIRTKMEEDKESYEEVCKQRSEWGKKGNEKRWAKERKSDKSIAKDRISDKSIANDRLSDKSIANVADTEYESDTDTESDSDTDTESVNDSESPTETKKKKGASPFVRPTLEQVSAYCKERGNKVDAETFIDYYNSNGWKVGRNPMKDWKATVRNWERKDFGRGSPKESVDDYLLGIINGGSP